MTLPISTDYAPMEAALQVELPDGDGWVFEPKWDGFRCIAFRDGDVVDLRSKAGKPLGRYFPDVVAAIAALPARRFVIDGEIVVPVGKTLSFDELQLRLHPAASRVQKLAAARPALYIVFDLLVTTRGRDMTGRPLEERREALAKFAATHLDGHPSIQLSPATADRAAAVRWLADGRQGLDGVIAKKTASAYTSGERTGMVKVKRIRTADCVIGGFRYAANGGSLGSLLLGLFEDGLLHHVGFCSALDQVTRRDAATRVEKLKGPPGFTGRSPGGPSRWRKDGDGAFEALRTELVVEVQYDHFTGGRFRHGTRFMRWRPDKEPASCTLAQVTAESGVALKLL